jgi:hypothetical protein
MTALPRRPAWAAGPAYQANPDDPDAPVRLDEHEGMREGDTVEYRDPSLAFGLTGPMTLWQLWRFDAGLSPDSAYTVAIVEVPGQDSPYEINADNLRRIAAMSPPRGPVFGGARPCTAASCGAMILDVITAGGGRSVVDAATAEDGTIALTADHGRWRMRVIGPTAPLVPGEVRVKSHFATCTEPGQFRKRKAS